MENWKEASEGDIKLLNALTLLYSAKEDLLHRVLNPRHPRLVAPSEKIKYESGVLSTGEQLLINIGLDVWDRSGGINFCDVYQCLDDNNFQNVLRALLYLRNSRIGPFKLPVLF